MGKPQGGAHVKRRRELLKRHGELYLDFRRGKLSERDLAEEVQVLRNEGIGFEEIVGAREVAMRGQEQKEGARIRVS